MKTTLYVRIASIQACRLPTQKKERYNLWVGAGPNSFAKMIEINTQYIQTSGQIASFEFKNTMPTILTLKLNKSHFLTGEKIIGEMNLSLRKFEINKIYSSIKVPLHYYNSNDASAYVVVDVHFINNPSNLPFKGSMEFLPCDINELLVSPSRNVRVEPKPNYTSSQPEKSKATKTKGSTASVFEIMQQKRYANSYGHI